MNEPGTASTTSPPAVEAAPPKSDPTQAHVAIDWEHTCPLVSCRFDPMGRFVFAGAEDSTVQRWTLGTGAKTALVGHESWVRSIAFTLDGEIMITGGCDGRLVWWPTAAEAPTPLRTLSTAHAGWIRMVAVSPDGQLVATAGNDNAVRLWRMDDGQLVRELTGHTSQVYSVSFHPAGEFIVSGDLMGQVHQWEVATGSLVRKLDAGLLCTHNIHYPLHFGGVRTMAFGRDASVLACGGLHKTTNALASLHEPLVMLLDWESGKAVRSQVTAEYTGVAWRVIDHPDGYWLGVAGGRGGGVLFFWKSDAEKAYYKFGLPNTVRDGDLHPDCLQVATAHYDKHLRITRLKAPVAFDGERARQ